MTINCPNESCQQSIEIFPEHAGKIISCPTCQQEMSLPEIDQFREEERASGKPRRLLTPKVQIKKSPRSKKNETSENERLNTVLGCGEKSKTSENDQTSTALGCGCFLLIGVLLIIFLMGGCPTRKDYDEFKEKSLNELAKKQYEETLEKLRRERDSR